jgi:glycosyltransferase involved in cell wall biosynthesis
MVKKMKSKKLPLVSVIIACKNNEKYIEICLESLKQQTYTNWELIVVDNFSTDRTFELAQKYTKNAYQLGPERSTQFNFGFTKSHGDLIYRIGAEYKLEPDLIEKCVAKINEGNDALALHNRSHGSSIWAQVRYLERESYRNDNTVVAVRFFKREVFESVDGFDESLVANEDFDLHNRIAQKGWKWAHVDAVEYHLGEPEHIGEVWNKFFYYGRTIRNYTKKHKSNSRHIKIYRSSFKTFYWQLIRQPKLLIAFFIYMTVKFVAGGTGYLIGPPNYLK